MAYHAMVALGGLFALISFIGAILLFTKKLYDYKLFFWLLLLSIPMPFIANDVGWIAAEVGRQPWAVYKLLRTADAASFIVPAWQILTSIIIFTLIYIILFWMFIKLLVRIIKKGPEQISSGY